MGTMISSLARILGFKNRTAEWIVDQRCLRCGEPLGVDALRLADEVWAKIMAKKMAWARERGVRLRVIRTVDAVCAKCKAWHTIKRERPDSGYQFELLLVTDHDRSELEAELT